MGFGTGELLVIGYPASNHNLACSFYASLTIASRSVRGLPRHPPISLLSPSEGPDKSRSPGMRKRLGRRGVSA